MLDEIVSEDHLDLRNSFKMALKPGIVLLIIVSTFCSRTTAQRMNVTCDQHGKLEPIKNESSLDTNYLVGELYQTCKNLNKYKDLLDAISEEISERWVKCYGLYKCTENNGTNTTHCKIPSLCMQNTGFNNDEDGPCKEIEPPSQIGSCLDSCYFKLCQPDLDCPDRNPQPDQPCCKETASNCSQPCAAAGEMSGQAMLAGGVAVRDVIIGVVSFILGVLMMCMIWFLVRRRESSRKQVSTNDQHEVFSLSQLDQRNSRGEMRNIYNEVDYPAMDLERANPLDNRPAVQNTARSELLQEVPLSAAALPELHLSQGLNQKTYATLMPDLVDKHLYAIDGRGEAVYTPKERTETPDQPVANNAYAILQPEEQTSVNRKVKTKDINSNGLESNFTSIDLFNPINANQEGMEKNDDMFKQMTEANCCYVASNECEGATGAVGGAVSDKETLVALENPVKTKLRLSSVVPAPDKDKVDRTSFHEYFKLQESDRK